jgi:hypothetical protein
MTNNIKLQMKRVFGNDRIYPACPVSSALIKLKKKAITFSLEDLKTFKSLNLVVTWVADQPREVQ